MVSLLCLWTPAHGYGRSCTYCSFNPYASEELPLSNNFERICESNTKGTKTFSLLFLKISIHYQDFSVYTRPHVSSRCEWVNKFMLGVPPTLLPKNRSSGSLILIFYEFIYHIEGKLIGFWMSFFFHSFNDRYFFIKYIAKIIRLFFGMFEVMYSLHFINLLYFQNFLEH